MVSPIDHDVPCLTCDYNLRGLQESARCPECGQSVRESLDVHRSGGRRLLFYTAPAWRVTVAIGLFLLVGSLIGSYALALLPNPGWVAATQYLQCLPIIAVIGVVLTIWPRSKERSGIALMLRMLILVAALVSLLYLVRFAINITPDRARWLARISDSGALAATIVLFAYLARLARQLPSRSYFVQAIAIMLLSTIAMLCGFFPQLGRPISVFHSLMPRLAGTGDSARPVELVLRLLIRLYFRDPVPGAFSDWALIGGVATLWAAGYHASLGWTLLRLRRKTLKVKQQALHSRDG